MKRKLYPTEKSILRGSRAARPCAGGAKACIRKTRWFGRRAAVFVTAAAACFAAAFCCRTAAADITLAVIAPKAGEYAQSGKELFDGARLAVREINDNGGLNGEKLDMLTIDDRCDDRLAISTAEMLTLLKSKKSGWWSALTALTVLTRLQAFTSGRKYSRLCRRQWRIMPEAPAKRADTAFGNQSADERRLFSVLQS